MPRADLSSVIWRKSSHSGSEQGSDCVEVAAFGVGRVAVRDSKDPGGPVLALTASAWAALADGIKGGAF